MPVHADGRPVPPSADDYTSASYHKAWLRHIEPAKVVRQQVAYASGISMGALGKMLARDYSDFTDSFTDAITPHQRRIVREEVEGDKPDLIHVYRCECECECDDCDVEIECQDCQCSTLIGTIRDVYQTDLEAAIVQGRGTPRLGEFDMFALVEKVLSTPMPELLQDYKTVEMAVMETFASPF